MKFFSKLILFFIPAVLFCQVEPEVISLWENGAPGFENRMNEQERAKDWWVKNIHNPSITMYVPKKEIANGTAVVICPGGGHKALVYNSEGKNAALYLNKLGITAFVLKYRLAREEGSPYSIEKHAKEDGIRAMKVVRSNAKKWNLNTNKIGMLGFSAGGEVVSMVAYDTLNVHRNAKNLIDQFSAKPSFQIVVYPGPLGIPNDIPKDAPPAFLVVANDDTCCSEPIVKILKGYRKANLSVEAHIYAKGGHAFNMGYRTDLKTLSSWPNRMEDWLEDNGYLSTNKN
jgi:acetyl esterase/lipase